MVSRLVQFVLALIVGLALLAWVVTGFVETTARQWFQRDATLRAGLAVSRMSGWTAHTLEQYRNNRLIRPRAEYKGNPDGMPWVALKDR